MIAAIGSDGKRPVVWGLALTTNGAIADAQRFDKTWDLGGYALVSVGILTIRRITEGEVDCKLLGIETTVDSEGLIVKASIKSTL